MTQSDRDSMIAIMEAMKPEKKRRTRLEAAQEWIARKDSGLGLTTIETVLSDRICGVESILTNLKPSNTKAQLLEGIEEAKAILNGDAA